MCEVVKRAILQMIAADDTASDDERERVMMAVTGEYAPLTICAAADRLGITRPTLYAMIRAGKIKRLADGRICGKSVEDYFLNKTETEGRAEV